MEILDNNKIYHVEFHSSTIAEFLQSMFSIGAKNYLLRMSNEVQFSYDEFFIEISNAMEKNLSRFIKQELEYFFDLDESNGIGYYCFINYMLMNLHITEINELIDAIEKSDIDTFISCMTRSFIGDYISKPERQTLYEEKAYNKLMEILQVNMKNELTVKEKLLESFENPIETKQRFCLLLRQFYLKSYKLFEKEILNLTVLQKDKYEKLFLENPRFFFTHYTKNDIDFYTPEKIHILPSFMKQAGSTCVLRDEQNFSFVILGSKNDEFYGKKATKDRLQKFFKILCDKKRLDIIDLLGERPHYVQEMAEKLNLTSATISYHMNFLYSFDLVCSERDEHRVYYSLNKEKAKSMFDEAVRTLLHQ